MLPLAAQAHTRRSEFPETDTPTSVPSISLSDPVIRGLVIASVLFLISLTALLVYLLCFYREHGERCWACRLCCRSRRKTKKGLRPFHLGNPDYALNADARHSRIIAGMAPESRGVNLGISGVSRLETRVVRPQQYFEDDGIFVVGDDDQHELENMSPKRRAAPRAAWPDMPSRPNETKASRRRSSLSEFSFGFTRNSTKMARLGSA